MKKVIKRSTQKFQNKEDEFFEIYGREYEKFLEEFNSEFDKETAKVQKNTKTIHKRYGIRQDASEDSKPNIRGRRYSIKDSGESDKT